MAPTSHAVTVCARGVELLNAPSVGQLLGNKLASYQVCVVTGGCAFSRSLQTSAA